MVKTVASSKRRATKNHTQNEQTVFLLPNLSDVGSLRVCLARSWCCVSSGNLALRLTLGAKAHPCVSGRAVMRLLFNLLLMSTWIPDVRTLLLGLLSKTVMPIVFIQGIFFRFTAFFGLRLM